MADATTSLESSTSGIDADTHRALHDENQDPEKAAANPAPEQKKRRQPFGAVWTVIACGFALMSDGMPYYSLN
jgi:hypothetical protein